MRRLPGGVSSLPSSETLVISCCSGGVAAIAEAGDTEGALVLVEQLDLDQYHYLHATRAELLRRLDRRSDARTAYQRALELVGSDAERRFLEQRLAELSG